VWDFSEPYRTAALFWEMHVGGAAIDAYLAMTVPFVAWALWSARTPTAWAAAAGLALLACYACLTTFSRGTYAAVALPLLLLAVLLPLRSADLPLAAVRKGRVGHKLRRAGWRSAAGMALAVALMLEVAAVFGTGSFMASRLADSDRDFGSRLEHWRNGVGLLYTPSEWAWGIGAGRIPASYARFVAGREFPGSAQWIQAREGEGAVRLFGPKTQHELGGFFALTQRVPLQDQESHRLVLDVRVLAPTDLAVSVCEMHLLYDGRCQTAVLRMLPKAAAWQRQTVELVGPPLPMGKWPATRLRVFALSPLNAGAQVEVDNLQLVGQGAGNLLRNGDFSTELAGWLPAAQYYFVPWHIDNLYLELLIERGLVGLLAFMVVVSLALHNLLAGAGRSQPVAPFLAASLCGVLLVGLVSSVMDMPRVAFQFWLLVLLALSLRSGKVSNGRHQHHTSPPALGGDNTLA
jgi:hypothetical protein